MRTRWPSQLALSKPGQTQTQSCLPSGPGRWVPQGGHLPRPNLHVHPNLNIKVPFWPLLALALVAGSAHVDPEGHSHSRSLSSAASASPDVAIWPHLLSDSWTAEATASLELPRPHHPTHVCLAGPGNSQGSPRLECCTPPTVCPSSATAPLELNLFIW